jgi:4-aminobutyrate aminotransferase
VEPYDPYQARGCCNAPIDALKWILKQQSAPTDTAAIIIEPIMGEGGFLTPPPSFIPALRKICDEHGILLIIDEVRPLALLRLLPCKHVLFWWQPAGCAW